MITLSYGVLQPQNGDKGSVFFPALNTDLAYLNDHTHDGVQGAPIQAVNIAPSTGTVLAANWVSVGGGTYRQLLVVPNGKNFADVNVTFKDSTTFQPLLLGVEAATLTTFYVYVNDSTVTLTASYRG
jgi:hypothetical protein